MGIRTNVDNTTPQGVEAARGADTTNETGYDMLSLEGSEILTLNSNKGSEYTNEVRAIITDSYKNLSAAVKPRVNVLDREQLENLWYSAVIASRSMGTTVYYYVMLLSATGNAPLTAKAMINEVDTASKTPGAVPFIYTPDDAVNERLLSEAEKLLGLEYGNSVTEFVNLDGVVIPHDDVSTEQLTTIVKVAANLAHNAINTEIALDSGKVKDINLGKINTGGKTFKVDPSLAKGNQDITLSGPIRADITAKLTLQDNYKGKAIEINGSAGGVTLAKTSCFVDAMMSNYQDVIPGQLPVDTIRFRPHIILTNLTTKVPSTSNLLISLITGLTATNKSVYMAALLPRYGDTTSVGALNLIANLDRDSSGTGKLINLNDKKIQQEKAAAIIEQLFPLAPMVSMDVESFGQQTNFTSILSTAADTTNPAASAAARELIKSAVWLTDGAFPNDFPITEIFADTGVPQPAGVWYDKDGVKDIRSIDMAFIANKTGDTALMRKWSLASLPATATNMDPYLAKVNIIASIIPDAEIRGKYIRVTFTAKFISTLVTAARAAGLNTRYEGLVEIAQAQNITVLNQYVNTAALDSSFSVGSPNITAQGYNYVTGGTYAGNRFM